MELEGGKSIFVKGFWYWSVEATCLAVIGAQLYLPLRSFFHFCDLIFNACLYFHLLFFLIDLSARISMEDLITELKQTETKQCVVFLSRVTVRECQSNDSNKSYIHHFMAQKEDCMK